MVRNKPPVNVRKNLWLALFKSLVVPVLLLAFFIAAPYWLNDKIRSEITNAVNAIPNLSLFEKQERLDKIANLDFQQVCFNPPVGFEKLHDDLVRAGIAARFRRLQWGLILSSVLMAGLADRHLGDLCAERQGKKIAGRFDPQLSVKLENWNGCGARQGVSPDTVAGLRNI